MNDPSQHSPRQARKEEDVDLTLARSAATEIAALLHAKARRHTGRTSTEPFFPYVISLPTPEFFHRVLVSDVSYQFSSTARPEMPQYGNSLFVSLKFPSDCNQPHVALPQLSAILGVAIYRSADSCPEQVENMLHSERVLTLLHDVDFAHVTSATFMPIQLRVVASLRTPQACARHVLLFRDLVTTAYYEARDKHGT
jgi:hypothetical protein